MERKGKIDGKVHITEFPKFLLKTINLSSHPHKLVKIILHAVISLKIHQS